MCYPILNYDKIHKDHNIHNLSNCDNTPDMEFEKPDVYDFSSMSPTIEIQKQILYDSTENYCGEQEKVPESSMFGIKSCNTEQLFEQIENTHYVGNKMTNGKSWIDTYGASKFDTNDNASSSTEFINCNPQENQTETTGFVETLNDYFWDENSNKKFSIHMATKSDKRNIKEKNNKKLKNTNIEKNQTETTELEESDTDCSDDNIKDKDFVINTDIDSCDSDSTGSFSETEPFKKQNTELIGQNYSKSNLTRPLSELLKKQVR